jgi:hypothetical protein
MKNNSPYSAAITGCGFMIDEMTAVLPLLMSDNADALLRDEKINNRLLKINTEQTRKKAITEFKRRYKSMPLSFWKDYLDMSPQAQNVAMFFVILKAYRICFDFQVNVVIKKWNSVSQSVTFNDVFMQMMEIAADDAFVDSWSDATKRKVVGSYLTILRKVGILDDSDALHPVSLPDADFAFYLTIGEPWFLEACLLQPYEIERIKDSAL